MIIKVTDPDGKGVKTTLKVTAEGASGSLSAKNQDVTFTVITSPDVSKANYWGHMQDTIVAGGMTFHRPTLKAELAGDTPSDNGLINNEEWTTVATDNVISFCANRGLQTPYASEYQTLANQANTGGKTQMVYKKYGWLKNWSYYAYDKFTSGKNEGERKKVDLGDGEIIKGIKDNPVACRNK
ncbi:putative invasin [Xenorhabdus beddingii]|uniref:Putative invasin n=1 Tax=Xenorhabdus beddingii TaxID=40578 RepID=A0A1Y2SM59_9GAMM|nr:putative invasin [Xenorhabdus beddingii]